MLTIQVNNFYIHVYETLNKGAGNFSVGIISVLFNLMVTDLSII